MTIPESVPFKSGFVGLAGVPNVGKSSLVNRLVGQKVTIVSRCPQTTRHRVCGILTEPAMQAVLVDVPGVLATENAFNQTLVHTAEAALRSCDLAIHLRSVETAIGPDEERVIGLLMGSGRPVLQVWNKMDLKKRIPEGLIANRPLDYEATFFISAKTGKGIDRLLEAIRQRLPEGPMLYPEEDVSDRDVRFLAAEFVREKAFLFLQQEIPYGVAAFTEVWDERPGQTTHVRIVIQTERDAHKAIIIGSAGSMLKRIGSAARRDIEELIEQPIYLELWVQVRPQWRKSRRELDRLGISGEMS